MILYENNGIVVFERLCISQKWFVSYLFWKVRFRVLTKHQFLGTLFVWKISCLLTSVLWFNLIRKTQQALYAITLVKCKKFCKKRSSINIQEMRWTSFWRTQQNWKKNIVNDFHVTCFLSNLSHYHSCTNFPIEGFVAWSHGNHIYNSFWEAISYTNLSTVRLVR